MLQPKRTKYRKQFKGRVHGNAKGGSRLNFGNYGMKAVTPGRITARQIEAARRAITRHMKRAGKVWIRVFPDVPVTGKPAEVRMGKGKGSPKGTPALQDQNRQYTWVPKKGGKGEWGHWTPAPRPPPPSNI